MREKAIKRSIDRKVTATGRSQNWKGRKELEGRREEGKKEGKEGGKEGMYNAECIPARS